MNRTVSIRRAAADDLAAILAISNWAAVNTPANFAIEPESLASWAASFEQTQRSHPWLVAEASTLASPLPGGPGPSSIVGFAKSSPHKGRCAYAFTAEVSVYIHPEHHRRGLGKALYSELIAILKAQGFVTLIAGITTPNLASERLHESFGFKRAGTFQRVGWKFGRWHDVGYWECFLRNDDPPPAKLKTVDEIVQRVSVPSQPVTAFT